MSILVTGGAGYIGSHTCIELIHAGYDIVVLDNLCNSKEESLRRVSTIVEKDIPFVKGDIGDRALLEKVFTDYNVDGVIHFAGLKAVGESCDFPLMYYRENVASSVTLFEVMQAANVSDIIFSSSATVYGDPGEVRYLETMPTSPMNPYGQTKLMVENMLRDACNAKNSAWRAALLRYFNPIGAHPSGLIGEDPNGIPNNLLPFVAQVAVGKREKVAIFGGDYPTIDGTGVRDYIHVVDLAKGHVAALNKLKNSEQGCKIYNLGAGKGSSVLEVIKAFEAAAGKTIPYDIVDRRSGDLPEYFADPTLALQELGWKTELDIHRMVEDTWRWQSQNPNGYES